MPVPGTARSGLIIPEDGRIRHVLESLENWSIWGIPADKGVLAEAGSGGTAADGRRLPRWSPRLRIRVRRTSLTLMI